MIGLCGLPQISDGAPYVLERDGVKSAKRREHVQLHQVLKRQIGWMSRHDGWPEPVAGAGGVARAARPGPHRRYRSPDDPGRFGWRIRGDFSGAHAAVDVIRHVENMSQRSAVQGFRALPNSGRWAKRRRGPYPPYGRAMESVPRWLPRRCGLPPRGASHRQRGVEALRRGERGVTGAPYSATTEVVRTFNTAGPVRADDTIRSRRCRGSTLTRCSA